MTWAQCSLGKGKRVSCRFSGSATKSGMDKSLKNGNSWRESRKLLKHGMRRMSVVFESVSEFQRNVALLQLKEKPAFIRTDREAKTLGVALATVQSYGKSTCEMFPGVSMGFQVLE